MKMPKSKILFEDMDCDFERFPLPISFDPGEEQRLLYRRDQTIKKVHARFNKMVKPKRDTTFECFHKEARHLTDYGTDPY